MYSQQTASKKVQSNSYCKVCADAKKPLSMITSHNVRNLKNGAITCPTLLEQSCKNCNQKGHTTSRCKKNNDMKEPEINKSKQEEPTKKGKNISSFSALMSDTESETESEMEGVLEVPICVPAKPLLSGYATALMSNAPKLQERVLAPSQKPVKIVVAKDPNRKFMWADCDSDSGGSEDEE